MKPSPRKSGGMVSYGYLEGFVIIPINNEFIVILEWICLVVIVVISEAGAGHDWFCAPIKAMLRFAKFHC
jgi:hypothetical protein